MATNTTLSNVYPRAALIGLARKRRSPIERLTVRPGELDHFEAEGWELSRRNKKTIVVEREKQHGVQLEDRVWMLLYRMGFEKLSGDGGGTLTTAATGNKPKLTTQIDVVGIDDEIVLGIECKSAKAMGKRPDLQEELAKHGLTRGGLAQAVNAGAEKKLTPILAFVARNAVLTQTDRKRAEDQQIVLVGDQELAYYETLAHHLGPAARYQFLADLVPGRQIPGLTIQVPAIKSKMGGYRCYTFSVSPEYLLKIAYVSHRARGHATDVAAYQRMVSRARLKKIRKYISEPDAIFPTNIVINLETGKGKRVEFARAKQEDDASGAVLGWLTMRPAYKAAWIIDGQHRLFAYSGHPLARNSRLSVLAFEGLPGHVQQKLFIDINAEQKSVKKSLLQELYADLHKNSDDPGKRTQAVISEAIQLLGSDSGSPFFQRVLLADSPRTEVRCISLASLFSALERPGLFYKSLKEGVIVNPGPFWGSDDVATVKRTQVILNGWFDVIRSHVPDWWDLGSADGGGLAMNDGVTACVNVLRSVVEHLDMGKTPLYELPAKDVVERLQPFATAVGEHFASMSEEERGAFRALRGVQGQTTAMRHSQRGIQEKLPSFKPDGLAEFLEREKAKTNQAAADIAGHIERTLQRSVITALKDTFGSDDARWWYDGVPTPVRTKVTLRQEEDGNKAGSREAYLDLIHYRQIILENWGLFGPQFGFGKSGDKKKKTEWLVRVNAIRNITAHASRGALVTLEEVSELEGYLEWLLSSVQGDAEMDSPFSS